ncbi:MAG: alpha/beta fold hydrolase [Aureispira sp.]
MKSTIKINVNNLTFDCRTTGNKENKLVLLLHGFPETSYMWRNLMSDLSAEGFYCVAPDLRGYSKGACPKGKKQYSLDKLTKDVIDIANALGKSTFHLVGHDWGSAIGWQVVHDYSDRILSWSGLSVPHLQAFGKAIVDNEEQQKMSQYIKMFQFPFLPERNIRKNNFKLFKTLWSSSEADELETYLKVFENPQQLTASLNYYRSNYKLLKKAAKSQILGNINVPTLFIWGKNDPAIGAYSVQESHQYIKGDYEYLELDAGHWLLQTQYNSIKEHLLKHISKYSSIVQ